MPSCLHRPQVFGGLVQCLGVYDCRGLGIRASGLDVHGFGVEGLGLGFRD